MLATHSTRLEHQLHALRSILLWYREADHPQRIIYGLGCLACYASKSTVDFVDLPITHVLLCGINLPVPITVPTTRFFNYSESRLAKTRRERLSTEYHVFLSLRLCIALEASCSLPSNAGVLQVPCGNFGNLILARIITYR